MTIFEDNAAYIEQVSSGFIKADRIKHISPHLFQVYRGQEDCISKQHRRCPHQGTTSPSAPQAHHCSWYEDPY
jgi:hypothetical protein